MAEDELDHVLGHIERLAPEAQIALVRRLRTVLRPRAQRELSERGSRGL